MNAARKVMSKIFKKFGGEEKERNSSKRETQFRKMFEWLKERFIREEKLKCIRKRKCGHNEHHEAATYYCGGDRYFSLNSHYSSLRSP